MMVYCLVKYAADPLISGQPLCAWSTSVLEATSILSCHVTSTPCDHPLAHPHLHPHLNAHAHARVRVHVHVVQLRLDLSWA